MTMRRLSRKCYGIFVILLLAGCSSRSTAAIRWLALSSVGTIDNKDSCNVLKGLVNRQKKVCQRNVEIMNSVREGAKLAIDECQWQFKSRRWNCSTVDSVSVFGNVLNQGTREAAFVHAMSSAGVAHAVTRACSSGKISSCGCDMKVRGKSPEGFEWSGCSDNIVYGSAFAKLFVDARDRNRRSDRALMNLHNNEAGRKSVEDNMKTECKCHGVSGSCELQTCWRAMPSFRRVGDIVKEKFDGATEVVQTRIGTRKQLMPLNKQFKPHTNTDLVYLTASPDFCEPDPKIGSLGTQGRLCNKSSKAIDGCELLCCGRGYRSVRRRVVERCFCKFHWCCYVKCKECEKMVDEHYCL